MSNCSFHQADDEKCLYKLTCLCEFYANSDYLSLANLTELKTHKMTIFSKIKWVASILLVFFIVLVTNLIDKGNFNRLRNSVTTIYEDRMVASDALFEMAALIHKKEVAILSSDLHYFQKETEKANHDIDVLIERYEQTKLTKNEREIHQYLKEELGNLKLVEKNYKPSDAKGKASLLKSSGKIDQYIHDLSKIQLREARQQMFVSDKAMDRINLFTQVEVVFLILMAILVQVIILYKPKES